MLLVVWLSVLSDCVAVMLVDVLVVCLTFGGGICYTLIVFWELAEFYLRRLYDFDWQVVFLD